MKIMELFLLHTPDVRKRPNSAQKAKTRSVILYYARLFVTSHDWKLYN